jgi:hypothetical protein
MKTLYFLLILVLTVTLTTFIHAEDLWKLAPAEGDSNRYIILDENGDPVTIRAFTIDFGMLLPSWIQYDDGGDALDNEDNRRLQNFWDYRIDPVSLSILKDNGYNVVRLMVAYHFLMPPDLQNPEGKEGKKWIFANGRYGDNQSALDDLEDIVTMIGDSGLKVIICVNRFPGGANGEDVCDMHEPDPVDELHFFDIEGHVSDEWAPVEDKTMGEWTIYNMTKFQEMYFSMWDSIADRFKGNTDIAAYEPVNEPCFYIYNADYEAPEWTEDEGLFDDEWDLVDNWYKALEWTIHHADTVGENDPHIIVRQVPHRYGNRFTGDDENHACRDYCAHLRSREADTLFANDHTMISVHCFPPFEYTWRKLGIAENEPDVYPALDYDINYQVDGQDGFGFAHETQEDPECGRPVWVNETSIVPSGGNKDKVGEQVHVQDMISSMETRWEHPMGGWGIWGTLRYGIVTMTQMHPDCMSSYYLEWDEWPHSSQAYVIASENSQRPAGIHKAFFHNFNDAAGNIENPFPEDFSDGETVRSGWTEDYRAPVSGSGIWSIENGFYKVTYDNAGSDHYASSRAGLNDWTDYAYTGTFKVDQGDTAMFMVRALSSQDFYAVCLSEGSSNNVRVKKRRHGAWYNIDEAVDYAISAGTAYRICIHVGRDPESDAVRITCALNQGVVIIDRKDSSTSQIPRGRAGVGACGESATAYFDDLNVIEDGTYYTDFKGDIVTTDSYCNITIPDVTDRGSFVADFRLMHETTSIEDNAPVMGFRFRVDDSDYYRLAFVDFPGFLEGSYDGNDIARKYSYLKLFESVNGNETQIGNSFESDDTGTPFVIESDKWYSVRVACRNHHLTGDATHAGMEIFVDDMISPVLSFYDENPRALGEFQMYFDGGGNSNTFRYKDIRIRRSEHYYEDHFNDSGDDYCFTFYPSKLWQETGGYLTCAPDSTDSLGIAYIDTDVAGSDEWRDYSVEGRFYIEDSKSDRAIVMLRYNVLEMYDLFYAVIFNAARDNIRVARYDSTTTYCIDGGLWPKTIDLNRWYDFDVRIQGQNNDTKIQVFLEDTLVNTAIDTISGQFEAGPPGFALNKNISRWDDLSVTRDPFISQDEFDDEKLDGWRVLAGRAEIDSDREVLTCYANDRINGNSYVVTGNADDSFYTIEGKAEIHIESGTVSIKPGFAVLAHFRDVWECIILSAICSVENNGLNLRLTSRTKNLNVTASASIGKDPQDTYHFRVKVNEVAPADQGAVNVKAWVVAHQDGNWQWPQNPTLEITDTDSDDHYLVDSGYAGLAAVVNHEPDGDGTNGDLEGECYIEFDAINIYK